jgi:ADP-heptose:LPS heptosyltransferase
MNILFAKTYGIGNAVLSIPALKAIQIANPSAIVDVLIGRTPDDIGALDVFYNAKLSGYFSGKIYVDFAKEKLYDLAILSIPFDPRWREGYNFIANLVLDGRLKPDTSQQGFLSWKKHEVEYQMENACKLGFDGEIPSCDFFCNKADKAPNSLYIGVGYKKDSAGFWKKKHWGNENFASFVKMYFSLTGGTVFLTGDLLDLTLSIKQILSLVDDERLVFVPTTSLSNSFKIVSSCEAFVGNDTGMMHVAASMGIPTLGIFFLENSVTKARPWGKNGFFIDGCDRKVSPDEVLSKLKQMLGLNYV